MHIALWSSAIFDPPSLPTQINRHFYCGEANQAYGSFFAWWGGWITAAHVLDAICGEIPEFTRGGYVIDRPGGLDAALIGVTLPDTPPPSPQPGEVLWAFGFPAGSSQAAHRFCKVYMERPCTDDSWIAQIITPEEPVVVGMSGGLVFRDSDHTPIGIIVTRNSAADLDDDGDRDQSLDFVALRAVYDAIAAS
ncbi:MAG: hypothetical protein AAFX02_00775 [Pseudomonadota bacterium]